MKTIQIQNSFIGYKSTTVKVNENAQFVYMSIYGDIVCYLTEEQIKDNFMDFDLEEEFKEIEALKIGQSYCPDGDNVYIRIKL